MAKRSAPEVNAGSMADIAFLLLIFFLVTTTIETDSGLNRKLPPIDNSETTPPVIRKRNMFAVNINRHNQLLVREELMELKDLRKAAIEFLDNGGGVDSEGKPCDYCHGKKDPSSSDHPDRAIISLKSDRETKYSTYISVQNELVAAYNHLRDQRAMELYGLTLKQMEADYADVNWVGNKQTLKDRIERVKIDYPQKLSEVQ